jgi:hypothetical protein
MEALLKENSTEKLTRMSLPVVGARDSLQGQTAKGLTSVFNAGIW